MLLQCDSLGYLSLIYLSLDLHDLEQFIDKKYCETRQRDRINCYNSNNLGASVEKYSHL